MHDLAVSESSGKLLERLAHGENAFEDCRAGQDRDVVFGEVDAGFEHNDQLDQLLFDWLQTSGESALELLGGDLRLVERLGVDQVADGFGLGKIDAAVEESTHGELARFGETRSGGDEQLDNVPEDDRRAVGCDLDNVVGSVGMRLGEVSDHDFVDASRVSSFRFPVSGTCGTGNRKLDTGNSR